jgi:membrane-bound lytic murein transglycosylase A
MDALTIQMQGSARVRLEDGTILRINYDSHNGYPYVPVDRILMERNIIPRQEISQQRIRDWMRANPEAAEEVLRQNRSFMFFRINGLSDDREAIGAQGVPLTPQRSIAIDSSLHVFGTPLFIQSGTPEVNAKGKVSFDHLLIAQDTGSAILGPARADVYWGAGDDAANLAVRLHQLGKFTMLVPNEIDPVAAGSHMPLPVEKPPVEKGLSSESVGKRPTARPRVAHLQRGRLIPWGVSELGSRTPRPR